jgi:flavin reductase (DIM6/NTAB) family NADH-FMN oxidoreductase RutF
VKKSLLKLKDYEIHAIGSATDEKINMNIASWVMQTSMDGKTVVVALYKPDFTIELVKRSQKLTISLLSKNQKNLLTKLGRKSGRLEDKISKVKTGLDSRGIPFLSDSVGYLECIVQSWADGGDHELAICKVLKSMVLNPDAEILTLNFLREKKLVRG